MRAAKLASRDHFILNPLFQDCLDLVQGHPPEGYNYSQECGLVFNSVVRLAIDESRVGDRSVFRVNASNVPVIVRKDVADALRASGLSGMKIRDLVDFTD